MQIEEEASLFEITRTQALSTSPTSCASHANLFQFKKNGRHLAIVQFSSAIFILQDQGAYGLLGNGAIEFLLPSGVQRGKFSIEEDCAIEWWQISWTPNVTLLHNYISTISATRNFPNISWKKWHPLGISISFTIAPSIFTINLHQEFSCLSSTICISSKWLSTQKCRIGRLPTMAAPRSHPWTRSRTPYRRAEVGQAEAPQPKGWWFYMAIIVVVKMEP